VAGCRSELLFRLKFVFKLLIGNRKVVERQERCRVKLLAPSAGLVTLRICPDRRFSFGYLLILTGWVHEYKMGAGVGTLIVEVRRSSPVIMQYWCRLLAIHNDRFSYVSAAIL